jgi:molecular chaperone GrpE (heat shock protein)
MLAELAAFSAAAKTVSAAIKAGRELSSVATSIGAMAQSEDDLSKRLSKKRNGVFGGSDEQLYEEFMALEEIRERNKELETLMVYTGRVGLKDDWVRFKAEARRQRKEAERAAEKAREQRMELIFNIIVIGLSALTCIGGLVALIWYVKGF